MMLLASCDADASTCDMSKEVILHLMLIVLTKEINGAIEKSIWYQVTHVTMASHDEKHHIAPHFNCLDLGNSVVQLMMPSASCDAHTGTDGII